MKAAVYYGTGKPEVLRHEDVPDPACAPSGVVIDRTFPLAEAAHAFVESRAAFGRVVLIP